MIFLKTKVTAVGPDVADLLEGGVLILFADGAPPELAEVSVLHAPLEGPTEDGPAVGATIQIGQVSAKVTAIGPLAWAKVREIGHVVVNFNDAIAAERPGEICAEAVSPLALLDALDVGVELILTA